MGDGDRVTYSIHPAIEMVQQWAAGLPVKTGRSLPEWVAHVNDRGPGDDAARRDWLKREHGFGTIHASWIVDYAAGRGEEEHDPDQYLKAAAKWVDAMYDRRPSLVPLHDALLALGVSMGPDVRVCPCKTIVPLYRKHVFAQVKPATLTRIDLGFALGDTPPTGRLISTGGYEKKDRITHRIPIQAPSDIDGEVRDWLHAAYERG